MGRVADGRVFGSFPRRMRRVVLKAEEERLRVRPRDDLDGLVRQQIGEIADAIDWRQVLPQVGTAA